jgi:hypothetical protein
MFQHGTVRRLGYLDAAANPPSWPPEPGPLNPLPHATVRIAGNEIVVDFDVDIVLNPGSREQRLVVSSGSPIRFVYRDGQFVLEGETEDPS